MSAFGARKSWIASINKMFFLRNVVLCERARSRRGKVEARGVVKHKLCGLALNRHKIRPIQKLNRFVQLEAPFGMRHPSKRGLDGSPFNQFGQCRNHALYQRVHTSGVGQGQREGESYCSGSLNKSAFTQTWDSVFNF